jgi:hypothetical protein
MLEYKRISDLTAAGAQDGTEILEVEQAGISKKISGDVPGIDGLSDLLRVSQGVGAHKKILLSDFLTALGITAHTEDVDASAANYTQTNTAKKQIYRVTSGAGSRNFNVLALALIAGCRVRIIKVDTGAGVTTVLPNGAETLQGATGFPLRKQWDYIEFESDATTIQVVSSLATLDSAGLAVTTAQSLAHGCGIRPRINKSVPICLSAELNYSVGDELDAFPNEVVSHNAISVSRDATNIKILPDTNVLIFQDKTTTTAAAITMAKWGIRNRYSL